MHLMIDEVDESLAGYNEQWVRTVVEKMRLQRASKRKPKPAAPLDASAVGPFAPAPANMPLAQNPFAIAPTAGAVPFSHAPSAAGTAMGPIQSAPTGAAAAQMKYPWLVNTPPMPAGPFAPVLFIDAQARAIGPDAWIPDEVLQSARYKALMQQAPIGVRVFSLAEYGLRTGLIKADATWGTEFGLLFVTAFALFEKMGIYPVNFENNQPLPINTLDNLYARVNRANPFASAGLSGLSGTKKPVSEHDQILKKLTKGKDSELFGADGSYIGPAFDASQVANTDLVNQLFVRQQKYNQAAHNKLLYQVQKGGLNTLFNYTTTDYIGPVIPASAAYDDVRQALSVRLSQLIKKYPSLQAVVNAKTAATTTSTPTGSTVTSADLAKNNQAAQDVVNQQSQTVTSTGSTTSTNTGSTVTPAQIAATNLAAQRSYRLAADTLPGVDLEDQANIYDVPDRYELPAFDENINPAAMDSADAAAVDAEPDDGDGLSGWFGKLYRKAAPVLGPVATVAAPVTGGLSLVAYQGMSQLTQKKPIGGFSTGTPKPPGAGAAAANTGNLLLLAGAGAAVLYFATRKTKRK